MEHKKDYSDLPMEIKKQAVMVDEFLEAQDEKSQDIRPDEEVQTSPDDEKKEDKKDYEELKKRYANLRNKRQERLLAAEEKLAAAQERAKKLEAILASVTDGETYKMPESLKEELGIEGEDVAAYEESINNAINSNVKPLREAVGQVTDLLKEREVSDFQRTQQQAQVSEIKSFLGDVSRVIDDDAFQIDTDPEFVKYCNETIDEYSGQPIINLLRSSLQAYDVARAAEIMKSFKDRRKKPSLPVKPNNAASPVPPAQGEQPITSEFIKKFYRDKRLGLYEGREDKADEIENKILLAAQRGMVT